MLSARYSSQILLELEFSVKIFEKYYNVLELRVKLGLATYTVSIHR